jgi:tRNA (Thr-GGU) A37 N-methylase
MGGVMEITFKPMGKIHTKGSDTEVREKGELEGELEIHREFEAGLQGIDGYSHLFLLVYSTGCGRNKSDLCR